MNTSQAALARRSHLAALGALLLLAACTEDDYQVPPPQARGVDGGGVGVTDGDGAETDSAKPKPTSAASTTAQLTMANPGPSVASTASSSPSSSQTATSTSSSALSTAPPHALPTTSSSAQSGVGTSDDVVPEPSATQGPVSTHDSSGNGSERGDSCSRNSQCSDGYCVDGVCCSSACSGACARCDDPAALGECTFTEHDNACPLARCSEDTECVQYLPPAADGPNCAAIGECLGADACEAIVSDAPECAEENETEFETPDDEESPDEGDPDEEDPDEEDPPDEESPDEETPDDEGGCSDDEECGDCQVCSDEGQCEGECDTQCTDCEASIEFVTAFGDDIENVDIAAMSDDGSTLVGSAEQNDGNYPAVISADGEVTVLESFGSTGIAQAVNGDGSIVAGVLDCEDPPDCTSDGARPFRWQDGDEPSPIADQGSVSAMSASGELIVGDLDDDDGPRAFAYHGESSSDLDELQAAKQLSANGEVVIGPLSDDGSSAGRYWYWDGELEPFDAPDDWNSTSLFAINEDGSVLAGSGFDGDDNELGFVWSDGDLTELDLDGYELRPRDIDASGQIVVGSAWDGDTLSAFIWTADNGTQLLGDVLQERGVDVDPSALGAARFISADGTVIVGDSNDGASFFRVQLGD